MNSNVIKVILVKTSWCGHCIKFSKIYNCLKDAHEKKHQDVMNLLDSQQLDDKSLIFEEFILNEDDKKSGLSGEVQFKKEYPKLTDHVKGIPTIFIMSAKGNSSIAKTISHTTIKDTGKQSESENISYENCKDAVNEFIQNIVNGYKSINSDNAVHIIVGQTDNNVAEHPDNVRSSNELRIEDLNGLVLENGKKSKKHGTKIKDKSGSGSGSGNGIGKVHSQPWLSDIPNMALHTGLSQGGGACENNVCHLTKKPDIYYKQKYLKYKSKYLELKENL